MDGFFASAKSFVGEVADAFHELAHEVVYEFRDNAVTGFGIPRLVTSVAALSVAGVAAAGTASVSLDMFSKVYGKRECKTCNGWEGLRCKTCGGTGRVQHPIAGLIGSGDVAAPWRASASSSQQTGVYRFAPDYETGLPLPWKDCSTCDATGVRKCTECKGFAWKGRLSLDNVMDVPWKVWDTYQLTEKPKEHISEVEDPATAAFMMFGRDELEGGFEYDDSVKAEMMWKYEKAKQYEEIRDAIARRKPGWEELQTVLQSLDPDRAMRDPIIVKDIPYYKAMVQIKAEVEKLQVPPRPNEWREKYELPLKNSIWKPEELQDPSTMKEINEILEDQKYVDEFFDAAWKLKWRSNKFEEIVKEKMQPYMTGQEERMQSKTDHMHMETESRPQSAQTDTLSTKIQEEEKKTGKKQQAEEKKKRERQERAQRLARQAAEREAALAKAKAGGSAT